VTFACTATPGDPRVGFVAEDVPALVATPGRQTLSALEIVAVLTRVVKEQQQAIQAQRAEYQAPDPSALPLTASPRRRRMARGQRASGRLEKAPERVNPSGRAV
jgi:hypothetical protein